MVRPRSPPRTADRGRDPPVLHALVDLVLHLDVHLVELLAAYGVWIYGILFMIVFAETGFVVTPFLPGDSLNYAIGRRIGPPAFSGRYRFLRVDYLRRTEAYFERYGGATVLVSRFVPIVRTVAPFVAGIGRMPLGTFQIYNVAGAAAWVLLFVWGGYFFGNIPWIKSHFGLVTIAIIVVSVVPLLSVMLRRRRGAARSGA
jgi:membrane-associated protein